MWATVTGLRWASAGLAAGAGGRRGKMEIDMQISQPHGKKGPMARRRNSAFALGSGDRRRLPAGAAPRPGGPSPGGSGEGDAAVAHAPEAATAQAPELKVPRLFQVILHNDDYTTMEFVVMCLTRIFHRSEPEAVNIMLAIHKQGAGVAGTYSFEVAEARQQKVSRMAREHEYPLKCTLEPA